MGSPNRRRETPSLERLIQNSGDDRKNQFGPDVRRVDRHTGTVACESPEPWIQPSVKEEGAISPAGGEDEVHTFSWNVVEGIFGRVDGLWVPTSHDLPAPVCPGCTYDGSGPPSLLRVSHPEVLPGLSTQSRD